eukprot:gnl/TRDRNA2_/TRDRNA2_74555_c1_seq1.p1 gnl/TRDRNA2_/TRDRNA2_74555_c1~~gnl/TRDRNA2_/TRDRNA2_74555_c1_seq1.p1  ORF type:complete len:406 (+),score=49.24 gnl/TRDRNA2_/TRDRNA2_74555_c1_seq1:89-1306(+)
MTAGQEESSLTCKGCIAFAACFATLAAAPAAPWFMFGQSVILNFLKFTVSALIPLVLMLVGGMSLNLCNPAYGILQMSCLGVCCACPCFLIFAAMCYLLLGPVKKFMEFRITGDVTATVCDWDAWRDKHGIYFKDGALSTLTPKGTHEGIPSLATVDHCSFTAGLENSEAKQYWSSCDFSLVPVFAHSDCRHCLAVGAEVAKGLVPCAWAVGRGRQPIEPDCGRLGKGGLCGVATDFLRLAPACHYLKSIGKVDGCSLGATELARGVEEAARVNNVTYDANVPLIHLGNPLVMEESLVQAVVYAIVLAVCYVPLPLCLFWTTARASGGYTSVKTRGLKQLLSRQLTSTASRSGSRVTFSPQSPEKSALKGRTKVTQDDEERQHCVSDLDSDEDAHPDRALCFDRS